MFLGGVKRPFLSHFLCLSFVFLRRFRCGNGGQTSHSEPLRLASERCCPPLTAVLLSCQSGVRAGCSRSWSGRIPTVIRPAHDRYPVGPRSWFAPQNACFGMQSGRCSVTATPTAQVGLSQIARCEDAPDTVQTEKICTGCFFSNKRETPAAETGNDKE